MSNLRLGRRLFKYLVLFLVGGIIYICMELLYDGSSDWTMFCTGCKDKQVTDNINPQTNVMVVI